MRVALDTNILAYAEGTNGDGKKAAALEIISKLPSTTTVLPAQALAELFNVLVRKASRTRVQAREAVIAWQDTFLTVETSASVVLKAIDLAADHQFSIWDAIIFSAAVQADCRLLLSEDLSDGFTWNGVTVANPFSGSVHPLLASLLAKPE